MTTRQDSWQIQDDLTLSETVLTHIRNGSTQLAAFEDAAEKLNRTFAACGFRWNNEVRKRYESEIAEAKQYRKENKKFYKKAVATPTPMVSISKTVNNADQQVIVTDYAEQIIQAAMNMKQQNANMATSIKSLTEELQRSREEIEMLKNKLYSETPETVASEDYNALIQILQRARNLGVLEKLSG